MEQIVSVGRRFSLSRLTLDVDIMQLITCEHVPVLMIYSVQ